MKFFDLYDDMNFPWNIDVGSYDDEIGILDDAGHCRYWRLIIDNQIKWSVEEEMGYIRTPLSIRNQIDILLRNKPFW